MNMKSIVQIGLVILAVMFVMKMMKGKKCEGFTQQKPQKVECNCNISREDFGNHATPGAHSDSGHSPQAAQMKLVNDKFNGMLSVIKQQQCAGRSDACDASLDTCIGGIPFQYKAEILKAAKEGGMGAAKSTLFSIMSSLQSNSTDLAAKAAKAKNAAFGTYVATNASFTTDDECNVVEGDMCNVWLFNNMSPAGTPGAVPSPVSSCAKAPIVGADMGSEMESEMESDEPDSDM